jgi:hypothetical protein
MGQSTVHVVTTDTEGVAKASSHIETAPEAVAIQREIEHTRAEMGETIDAIQRKLDPAVLKEQAKEKALEKLEEAKDYAKTEVKEHIAEAKHAVRDATVGRVEHMVHRAGHGVRDVETTVVDRIRENPIPAAMIGAGLAWLLMSGKKEERRPVYRARYGGEDIYDGDYSLGGYDFEYGYQPEGRIERAKHRVQNVAGNVAGDARELASDARDRVANVANRTREGAADLASTASEGIHDAARFARTEARELRYRARSGARRLERGFESTYREAPIGVGLAALAIGALAGIALPRTRREDELMGSTRDKLIQKAESAAESALDRVSNVAEEKLQQPLR